MIFSSIKQHTIIMMLQNKCLTHKAIFFFIINIVVVCVIIRVTGIIMILHMLRHLSKHTIYTALCHMACYITYTYLYVTYPYI